MLLPRALVPAAVAMSLALGARSAAADRAGDQRLAAVDDAATATGTVYYELKATTIAAGSTIRHVAKLALWIKGDRRLAQFTAPADLKGTRIFVDGGQVYLSKPTDAKPQPIMAGPGQPGVVGLAFQAADLASQPWSCRYTATLIRPGDDAHPATLLLRLKPGVTGAWPKVEMDVSLDDVPTELRFFVSEAAGRPVRVEKRDHRCDDDGCAWTTRLLEVRNGELDTRLETTAVRIGAPIADKLFTARALPSELASRAEAAP